MPIAPPAKLDLFEDWAEDTFQAIGTGTAITINPTRRDRRGWDFIAEWDEDLAVGVPRDRQVVARAARVQVKSSRQSKPTARLKLSNALRFVEASEPCFVVMYWLDRARSGVEVFARHFDEELIAATLKRVREADRDGQRELHKLTLLVPMKDDDLHTDDLIPWLRSQCAEKPADYSRWKAEIRESVGGRGLVGALKVPAAESINFIEHAVGLRDFDPSWVEFRETRFGIASSTVEPIDDGVRFEVALKGRPSAMHFETASGESVSFNGVTKSIRLPGHADAGLVGAFHAKYLTTRIHSSLRMDTTYNLAGSDIDEIRALREVLKLFCMFGTEQMFVVYELEGERLDRGFVTPTPPVEERDMFLWAIDRLEALLACTRASEHPRLCVADMLERSQALDDFYSCIEADSTTLRLSPTFDGAALPEPTGVAGYCHVEIATTVFAAFYHQPLLSRKTHGADTVIEFGRPQIVERWARSGVTDEHAPRMRRAFQSMLKRRPAGTAYFNEGDMMSALRGARHMGMRVADRGP